MGTREQAGDVRGRNRARGLWRRRQAGPARAARPRWTTPVARRRPSASCGAPPGTAPAVSTPAFRLRPQARGRPGGADGLARPGCARRCQPSEARAGSRDRARALGPGPKSVLGPRARCLAGRAHDFGERDSLAEWSAEQRRRERARPVPGEHPLPSARGSDRCACARRPRRARAGPGKSFNRGAGRGCAPPACAACPTRRAGVAPPISQRGAARKW